MANFDTIKTAIDANINTNGKQEITGGKMNSILKQMVDATDEQLTELESELKHKIVPLAGFRLSSSSSLSVGDYYIDTDGKLRKVEIPGEKSSVITPDNDNLYVYEDKIYRHHNGSLILMYDTTLENITNRFTEFESEIENIDKKLYNRSVIIDSSYSQTSNILIDLKKGVTYRISAAGVDSTIVLFKTDAYDANEPSNFKLYDSKNMYDEIVTLSDNYPKMHIYVGNTLGLNVRVENIELTDTIKNNGYEVDASLENGKMSVSFNKSNDSYKVRTRPFFEKGLYLVSFPDELAVTYVQKRNSHDPSISRMGITSNTPISQYNDDICQFSFARKDGGTLNILDTDLLSQIHVYFIRSNNPSDTDVVVAASDSLDYHKAMANIVCDGTNDTDILAALFGCHTTIKVRLEEGHYRINKMWSFSDTCKISLCVNEHTFNDSGSDTYTYLRRYIDFGGKTPCCPQAENSVFLVVDELLHNNLAESSINNIILGTPRSILNKDLPRNATSLILKNFNVVGHYYNKPVTYIDTTRCYSTMIDCVCVRSWADELIKYTKFAEIPNVNCVGLRVGRGSCYGIQNQVKNSSVWYCGVGVSCCGEHYIFEDVKTHHNYIGWAFGDISTRGAMEHPNILMGCSIEGCYRLMELKYKGSEEIINYTPSCTLVVIGMSTELHWHGTTDGSSADGTTLPIKEYAKNYYRGRIEIDYPSNLPLFEDEGGEKFKVTLYNDKGVMDL